MRVNRIKRLFRIGIILLVFAANSLSFRTALAVTDDLFISEYIEGSSNNKAIEIYNGTGATVDLLAASYSIRMYFNGNSTPATTIYLTGTVAPGDVYVVTQSSANAAILAQADQISTSVGWFNGNDAVVLTKGLGFEIIDSIGRVGEDPGTYWGDTVTNTLNHTLVRKPTISAGDKNASDAYDPSTEWTASSQDTTTFLGSHQINTHIVSYVSNGGSAVGSETVITNTAARQPNNPTRTDFIFDGWYIDSSFVTPYNFSAPVTIDISLYAKWTANSNPTPIPGPVDIPKTGDESHIGILLSVLLVNSILLAIVFVLMFKRRRT